MSGMPYTTDLVDYLAGAKLEDFPRTVLESGRRALVNIAGCMVSGSRHPSVDAAWAGLRPFSGAQQATLFGRPARTDAMLASFLNCLSSCIYTYDDAHADAVVHPSGPVACALFALCETKPVSGAEFMEAFILGVEATCRLSMAISVNPARGNIGFSQTGVAAGIGAAVAAAKLLKLERPGISNAIAVALTQASGVRVTQGSAASGLIPAQAAPAGLRAAVLAQSGFTGPSDSLEGKHGFSSMYSLQPSLGYLTRDLGSHFEIDRLTFKPYPCGIVIGPVIDACVALWQPELHPCIEHIDIRVHPVTLALANRQHPQSPLAAQVSLQHWAAFALVYGEATLVALAADALADDRLYRLRQRMRVETDESMEKTAARLSITCSDGRVLSQDVAAGIGSLDNPMTDEQLTLKFRQQCSPSFPAERIEQALASIRRFEALPSAAAVAQAFASIH